MIEIKDLSFSYKQGKTILSDLSLYFGRGESWSIIGPSGCGKSTLLSLLAGLNRAESGRIIIAGKEIHRPRPETGLVLQDHGLLPWLTVYENTMMGHKIRKFYGPDGVHCAASGLPSDREMQERVEYWLNWLGISAFREMYPEQLSRGQRQRAAIARSLVLEPDLLLMDEPFSALDAPIREELQGVMNRFHRESCLTSITVTHDIEEAVVLGERILVLGLGGKESVVLQGGCYGEKIDREATDFRMRCLTLRDTLAQMGGAREL